MKLVNRLCPSGGERGGAAESVGDEDVGDRQTDNDDATAPTSSTRRSFFAGICNRRTQLASSSSSRASAVGSTTPQLNYRSLCQSRRGSDEPHNTAATHNATPRSSVENMSSRVGDDGAGGADAPRHMTGPLHFGPMLLKPSTKSAMLVTCAVDELAKQVQVELARCKWTSRRCGDRDDAVHTYRQHWPHLVVIDARRRSALQRQSWHPCDIAHSLYSLKENNDTVFIALVDKWPDENRLKSLADSGISQIVRVASGIASFRDCLQLLELVWPLQVKLRAVAALFAIVEDFEVPIEITDCSNHVQSSLRSQSEDSNHTAGKRGSGVDRIKVDSWNCLAISQPSAGDHHLRHGSLERILEANPSAEPLCQADNLNSTTMKTDEVSFCHSEQYVYMKKHLNSSDQSRSITRDLAVRTVRSSVNQTFVEAPITEILGYLKEALQRTGGETEEHRLIREAMKALSQTELYAPLLTRFKVEDRVANGYFDGLIRLNTPKADTLHQRKQSVYDVMRWGLASTMTGGDVKESARRATATAASTPAFRPPAVAKRLDAEVQALLDDDNTWKFDVLALERLTGKRPLVYLGKKVFERWKLPEYFKCPPDVLWNWLKAIEAGYHWSNTYHNATHAADVLQATSYFLCSDRVSEEVEHIHAVATLLGAAIHDLDHPGRGNAFLINAQHRLAVLYNDMSVLENHHAALAFRMTMDDATINIFASLSRDDFNTVRAAVIDVVLATDMRKHFEHLAKFTANVLAAEEQAEEIDRDSKSLTICRMLIKCADVANPARPFNLCKEWAYRIVEEYFVQTDDERTRGQSLTMEVFDRHTCNVPLTQCGFIDMFMREMFSSWCEFSEIHELLAQVEENYKQWQSEVKVWSPKSRNSNMRKTE